MHLLLFFVMHVRVTVCMCVCFLYVCFACCKSNLYLGGQINKNSLSSFPFQYSLSLSLSLAGRAVYVCVLQLLLPCSFPHYLRKYISRRRRTGVKLERSGIWC